MKRWIMVIGLVFAIALIVSACGNSDKATEETSATGEVKEFTINASNCRGN